MTDVRFGHTWVLARMFMVFIVRKVLSVGALRARSVRVALAVATILVMAFCAVAATLFLEPVVADEAQWNFILHASTVSAVLWTGCGFVVIKVLLLGSQKLLELSFQMPVTGRERAVSLLIYEVFMVVACSAAGLFSVCIAALWLQGLWAVLPILLCVVVPVLITYCALSLLHVSIVRLGELTPLRRVAPLVAIVLTFVALLLFARQVPGLTMDLSRRYLERDTSFSVIAAPTWLAERIGVVATLALAAALIAAGALATVTLMPQQHVRSSSYIKAFRGAPRRPLLGVYDLCFLRSTQTWLSTFVATGVFIALLLRPQSNPLWATSVLPLGGLYLFAATAHLRTAGWDRRPAWGTYWSLVRAQLVLVATGFFVGVGVALFRFAVDPPLLGTWQDVFASAVAPGAAAVVTIVVTTFISVMFPAEHDNPFSVFLGVCAFAVLALIVATGLGVLGLTGTTLVLALAGLTLTLAAYTIAGIHNDTNRRRHEKVSDRGQQRRRRSAPHSRRSGGNTGLFHVLK